MDRQWLSLAAVAVVCFAAAPAPNPVRHLVTPEPPSQTLHPVQDRSPPARTSAALAGVAAAQSVTYPPTDAELDALVRTDPVAALDACRRRVRAEVKTYRATLHKQERIHGTLHDPEELTVVARAEPYAILMKWTKGAREVKLGGVSLGKIEGGLYAGRETGGKLVIYRPTAPLLPITSVDPIGDQARASARYSIAEGSLFHAVERTYRAWAAAQRDGKLAWKYEGKKPMSEVAGRECHVLVRTGPPTVDPFLMDEPNPDPKGREADVSATVRLMIDVRTWLQIGTEIRNAKGEPVGFYYFRDLEVNPKLPADQFTREALRR